MKKNAIRRLTSGMNTWSIRRQEPEESMDLALTAKKYAEALDYETGAYHADLILGVHHVYQNDYANGLDLLQPARDYFERTNNHLLLVPTLNTLGMVFIIQGRYGEALAVLHPGAELARQCSLDDILIFILHNIAEIYKDTWTRFDDALVYLEEASELCLRINHSFCGVVLASKAICLHELRRTEEGLGCADKALELSRSSQDVFTMQLCYQMLALMYYSLEDWDKVIENCSLGMALQEQHRDEFHEANLHLLRAKVAAAQQDSALAIDCANNALTLSEKNQIDALYDEIYEVLSIAYEQMGQYKKALACNINHIEHYKKRLNRQLDTRVSILTAEMKIRALEKDAEIQRLRNVELRDKNELLTKTKEQLLKTLSELEETYQQLLESEKNAALGALVAGVAHEINTPVGSSITLTSYLQEELAGLHARFDMGNMTKRDLENSLTRFQESLGIIDKSLAKAASTINSFKSIAVQTMNHEAQETHLSVFLQDLYASIQPKLEMKKHTLTIRCTVTEPVTTHPGALFQVISHLIDNSVHHGFYQKSGGTMHIHVSLDGDQIHIVYTDNGCGIPENQANKVFEPFFSTRKHHGFTGLGLQSVYNLVTQILQGTIQLTSAPNAGVRFDIYMPYDIAN